MVPDASPRYRWSFGWNLLGNTLYSASQWLLIVILARLAAPEQVGSFALMLAIAAPVFLTVGMNLRTLQVTDFERKYALDTFYRIRSVQSVIATAITISIGLLFDLRGWLLVALAILCVAKSVESYSQSTYGYFQVRRRLDLVSKSLIIRAVTGPALYGAGLVLTEQIAGGVVGLVVAWAATQFGYDRRMANKLLRQEGRFKTGVASPKHLRLLLKDGVFLGADQGVSSLSVNIPRYAIELALGTAKVGIYASQAYLAQVITMIADAMIGVLMPDLVAAFHKQNTARFLRIIGLLAIFAAGVFVIGVGGAYLLGDQFVRWVLGPDYISENLLVWLMASAGAATLQRVLSKALEASRRFSSYLWIDIATAVVIASCMLPFVFRFGLPGAAMAMAVGYLVGSLLFGAVLVRILREMRYDVQEISGEKQ